MELFIDELPPGLNERIRMSRWHKAEVRDRWFWLLVCAMGTDRPQYQRAKFTITRQGGYLDPDNLYSTVKDIMDAFVYYKVIPDDTDKHVVLDLRQDRDAKPHGVRIVVEELT